MRSNPTKIAGFILEKPPNYVFCDGAELTDILIIYYLKNILFLNESSIPYNSCSLVLTKLDTYFSYKAPISIVASPNETLNLVQSNPRNAGSLDAEKEEPLVNLTYG